MVYEKIISLKKEAEKDPNVVKSWMLYYATNSFVLELQQVAKRGIVLIKKLEIMWNGNHRKVLSSIYGKDFITMFWWLMDDYLCFAFAYDHLIQLGIPADIEKIVWKQ